MLVLCPHPHPQSPFSLVTTEVNCTVGNYKSFAAEQSLIEQSGILYFIRPFTRILSLKKDQLEA